MIMTPRMANAARTTCDIYRDNVAWMVERGDVNSLAEMVSTWYARCDFGTSFDGSTIKNLGVYDNGTIWIDTASGRVEYRHEVNRWRLIEEGDCDGGDAVVYSMARIAEVTQVPFAYLCGLRDAIHFSERNAYCELSARVKSLRAESAALDKAVHQKRMSVDAVFVSCGDDSPAARISSCRYPDAPKGLLGWDAIRKAHDDSPGVYFAWSDGQIVYVGATEVGLKRRFNASHHAVTRRDRFSFVCIPANEVFFAECYYIAKYAPIRNSQVSYALGTKCPPKRGKRKER